MTGDQFHALGERIVGGVVRIGGAIIVAIIIAEGVMNLSNGGAVMEQFETGAAWAEGLEKMARDMANVQRAGMVIEEFDNSIVEVRNRLAPEEGQE